MKKTNNNLKDLKSALSGKDKYGNNIAFPSNIMSDMTTKGLLGKWTSLILSETLTALYKYHMEYRNIDAGDKSFVISRFRDVGDRISNITPVLNDLVDKNINGIEDIFIAVYGIASDEVYVLREFMRLLKNMASWDEDYMWTDCTTDKRLRSLLLGED